MKVLYVVGAHPNIMKAAPVIRALERSSAEQVLVHTGQHYDKTMSDVFFEELGMRVSDLNLRVGSATQTQQAATIMSRFEPVLDEVSPDVKPRLADELDVLTPDKLITQSLSYLDFLCLQKQVNLVNPDFGGVREETTYLGVPCLTLRDNTELPVTTEVGTTIVFVRTNVERLREELTKYSDGKIRRGAIPPLWDGHASDRIADILIDKLVD
jgi:UDP-N-acetylglucosamine 2-epimerase